MQCKREIEDMRRRSNDSLNKDEDLEMQEVHHGDEVPLPEVKGGKAEGTTVRLKWNGAKYFYLIGMFASLILPWLSIANWAFDVIIAQKLWNGEQVYGDDDGGSYPVNTRNYAIAYMTVLILSLRHQTLFFIIRNNSFPFFDQYSAWSKIRTAVFYIPVIGSIRQSRMTINNYEENILKPDGQTLNFMNRWATIFEGALFIEIAAWVTIPFMMVRKVLWTLRVWKNDVSDDMKNSEDFVINGDKAKRKKEEKENQESQGEGEDSKEELLGILSVSESDFNKKANPIYSVGFTYEKFLEYVSMWTSCLEDLPQLLILIILEVVLQVTNARGDIAHAPNPDGFVETVKITVKQVNSILGSQPVVWAKLTTSLAQLLRTFHLLRTSNIVDFMEAKDEKKMGPNFKLRT